MWALEILAEEGCKYDSSIFPICHDRYGIPDAHRYPFSITFYGGGKYVIKELDVSNMGFKNMGGEYSNSWSLQKRGTAERKCRALNDNLCSSRILYEFPISTIRVWKINLPISGGGYFRITPYWITKMGLKRINNREERSFLFYLHPWEIDPEQPRIVRASRLSRFRHYSNLRDTEKKLEKLLSDFQFTSFKEVLKVYT
jgi:polysaccharide deacetylase family protein (PEP-CTERM system associated)